MPSTSAMPSTSVLPSSWREHVDAPRQRRSSATLPDRIETVIVGAGQAGLALSRCLTELDRPHVLLERGRIAERWRSERWDSFRLLSPNWHTRLPGHRYDGDDPDGFMDRASVVRMFERYARSFAAPVVEGVSVRRVAPIDDHRWWVDTDVGEVVANNVVVATGPHGTPCLPACAADLPPRIDQLHSSHYRNPQQLPDGGVLVVGSGPTGQQLASELARSGRDVYLAVGRHSRVPRTYRGRDAFWWLEQTGASEETVDPARSSPRPSHPVLTADRDLGLDVVAQDGVRLVGRLLGVESVAPTSNVRGDPRPTDATTRLRFDDEVAHHYLEAEASAARFRAAADAHAADAGLDLPAADPVPPPRVPDWARDTPRYLDVEEAGLRTVLWATGFRRELGWLPRRALDDRGEPIHHRGVTALPGLYVLGLSWLYRRASASIDGVGADARYLAEHIAAGTSVRRPTGRDIGGRDVGGHLRRGRWAAPMAHDTDRRMLVTSQPITDGHPGRATGEHQ